jgi:hypothetical protein
VEENTANTTVVGTVAATDADTAGVNPARTFRITAGNTGGAFAINSSGEITVADASKLDYESGTQSYTLTVQVSDEVNAATSQTVTIPFFASTLMSVADASGADTVLIVAHNPTIQETAAFLAAPGGLGLIDRVRVKYPTCGLAVLDLSADDPWASCSADLAAFEIPRA